jgi:DNA-binding CsgD family transcriptional regulator
MASPVLTQSVEKTHRILVIGETVPNLDQIVAQYPHAPIVPERHSVVHAEFERLSPEIVICSGSYFLDLLRSSAYWLAQRSTSHLPTRRADVLKFVLKGFSNREIAAFVGVTERVVKSEVSELLRRFEVSNRTELATLVAQAEYPS